MIDRGATFKPGPGPSTVSGRGAGAGDFWSRFGAQFYFLKLRNYLKIKKK